MDPNGRAVPIVMGSYGIGVERILAAVIEQSHDQNGIIFPPSIAPFEVVVTITDIRQESLNSAAEKIYRDLKSSGCDVLLDDRDERAGVKFKDADIIGIPYRINVGKRANEEIVELVDRRTKEMEEIRLAEIKDRLDRYLRSEEND